MYQNPQQTMPPGLAPQSFAPMFIPQYSGAAGVPPAIPPQFMPQQFAAPQFMPQQFVPQPQPQLFAQPASSSFLNPMSFMTPVSGFGNGFGSPMPTPAFGGASAFASAGAGFGGNDPFGLSSILGLGGLGGVSSPSYMPGVFPPPTQPTPAPKQGGDQQMLMIIVVLMLCGGQGGLDLSSLCGLGGPRPQPPRPPEPPDYYDPPRPRPRPPRPPEPPPPPPPPPVWSGHTGGTWGDPHFKDLTNPDTNVYAKDYDVKGEVGKTYNILSDKSIQFNAEFVAGDPTIGTIMGNMGIKLFSDDGSQCQVQFDGINGGAKYNGQAMAEGETHTMKVGGKDATIKFQGGKLFVNTAEYDIELMKSPDGNHGDQKIKVNGNVLSDWVNPEGLLGQTADGDKNIRKGTDENGKGAINYNYKKYEVADLFANPDADINRYGRDLQTTVENGKVTRLRTQEGLLTATLDKEGNLVSVRYVEQADGTVKKFLADGTTEINDDGSIK
jgi:hypothetical protein